MIKKLNLRKNALRKIIVLVAVCFIAVMFVNQFSRLNYYNGQIKELESKIAAQEQIKDELAAKQNIYSSKEYIEQIARDTLGLVRANEKVYIDSNNIESE